jgi:type VI secretion system protein ImpE
MKAKELLDAGRLTAAIDQLGQEVKASPTDTQRRTFLFELLCFAGDYQRAERQLDVIGQQSTASEVGVQVYRNALAAEKARRQLFAEGRPPAFLFPPPAYAALHLDALTRVRENRPAAAKALIEQAESSRTPPKGRIDGSGFGDFRDSDDLLSPFLEVFVHDRYAWLPFEQIRHLKITAPKRLRDLMWIPATLESHSGSVGEVFLPVLYAGSSEDADDQVRLGRMTNWTTVGEGLARGTGQRLFLVDDEERAMLEVREVEFDAPAPSA